MVTVSLFRLTVLFLHLLTFIAMPKPPLSEFYDFVNKTAALSVSDKKSYDFIVIGLGSMGSSTCYHLAAQGYTVLGLEQFEITHNNGSHAGQSRLIRQAYFEHPDYVPLLQEAYTGWEKLEKRSNSQLFYKTGILYSGRPDDFLISGSLKSAIKHDLNIESISQVDVTSRFPQFNLPSHYKTIFEPKAGFVTPERAILTYLNEALKCGAEVRSRESVLSWQETSGSIKVRTNKGQYSASKLIITAGAWTGSLLPDLKSKITVSKQLIAWVNTMDVSRLKIDKIPCWGVNQEDFDGLFYGFPILDHNEFGSPAGLKIGYHYPGEIVEPDNYSHDIKPSDKDILIDFMAQFMPGIFKTFNEIKTCLYTNSPDDHFIIDQHPDHKNLILATGFSGHGFKFIPVIGQALADLVIKGKTELPIEFLSLKRFG